MGNVQNRIYFIGIIAEQYKDYWIKFVSIY